MRAFVALELPEAFAEELAGLSHALAATCEGRFVQEGSHHLTLAFLGEMGEAEARLAMDALDAACTCAGSVRLVAEGLGTFGRGRNVTLWLGVRVRTSSPALRHACVASLRRAALPMTRRTSCCT